MVALKAVMARTRWPSGDKPWIGGSAKTPTPMMIASASPIHFGFEFMPLLVAPLQAARI